ncbi:MAG: PCRF domain-containing protein, partial [Candidatus Omnitrophica bacterium]|nr:PCRF domain-containing protein [Candidatus Omnitrophota bacterium]
MAIKFQERADLIEKIEGLNQEFEDLVASVSKPVSNPNLEYRDKLKRIGEISEIVEKGRRYLSLCKEMEELRELETQKGYEDIIEQEYERLSEEISALEKEIEEFFFFSPQDSRDCIVEIRAGTGGQEAALFAADLFRMYSKFAEKKNWKIEVFDFHASELGGFKEIIFLVRGERA